MLKTVLLLLPLMFNTQAATVQTQVSVPEMQRYCIEVEVPVDPRMPEYVDSVYEVGKENTITDVPTPIPYYGRRNGSTVSDYNGNTNNSSNNTVNDSDSSRKGIYMTDNDRNNTNGSSTDGNTNSGNANNNGTNRRNSANRGYTTDKKDSMNNTADNVSPDRKDNTNPIVTIDDGDKTYSSYQEAYDALKGKFDTMFTLQSDVDELRRELMSKETELMIHQNLYQERLKSLVEKWNND